MRAFTIGRSRKSDVVIDHASVSREHAELVATEEGRYYLTDCSSANGTYRLKHGEWKQIRQEFIAPDEVIILGEYKTSARKLASALPTQARRALIPEGELVVIEAGLTGLEKIATATGPVVVRKKTAKDELPSGEVERDPETGEIIRSGR